MGRGRDRRLSQGAANLATSEMEASLAEQQAAEAALGNAQNLLGTDAQIAGTLGAVDDELLKYSMRYNADPSAWVAATGSQNSGGITSTATVMNDLMKKAEEAYLAGDKEGAAAFYEQAKNAPNAMIAANGQFGQFVAGAYTLVPGENYETYLARQAVSGPMAQTVGGIVKEGRDLLDPSGAAYQEKKTELEADALAAIDTGKTETLAAVQEARDEANTAIDLARERELRRVSVESEQAKREVRDLGLQRGAARSAAGEASTFARFADTRARMGADVESMTAEQKAKLASETATQKGNAISFFASERANLLKDTRTYMNDFVAEFTTKAPLLAQAFLQNQAGLRDSYLNRLQAGRAAIADTARFLSQQYMEAASQQTQERIGSMQKNAAMLSSLVNLGGDILSGFISGGLTYAGMRAGGSGAGAGGVR